MLVFRWDSETHYLLPRDECLTLEPGNVVQRLLIPRTPRRQLLPTVQSRGRSQDLALTAE